jgi:alkyl hydroperoxide reductase subunit AhpC
VNNLFCIATEHQPFSPPPNPLAKKNSGLFIIAPDGTLRQKTVNDLPVGRSVDETLRLVKAFQFTDEHGEVRGGG